ncbi:response regulator transcription factor, partial [Microbacterium natoriense]|uniref:response regulator n=1 Tax=Microbacterium natoriense TaxID=284570 RepID=UPI0031DBD9A0
MSGERIRVLIVDDHELIRRGMRMVLDAEDDLDVIGEAVSGTDAVHQAEHLAPDVVLMDIRMPEMDGIEATRRIVRSAPSTRVLVLTTFDLDEYAFGSLRAGASGFLLKNTPPATLTAAIR